MSELDYEQQTADRGEAAAAGGNETVGVGLVATPDNGDAIAGAILRAQRHGCRVFVACTDDEVDGVRFAKQLDATVVDPLKETAADEKEFRQLLAGTMAETECAGLIFVLNPDRRIDFERSVARLDDRSVCDAVYKTDQESDQRGIVVGIPAYNEAATIEHVIKEANEYAESVLVVDDGSDDETSELARKAGATVVEHPLNRGYGAALQTLFSEAHERESKHLVIIDADGQHDPADIPAMVKRQREQNAELIIGSRFVDGGSTDAPIYRRVGLSIVNKLTNLSMGIIRPSSAVSDTQSGFRAYSRGAVASLATDDAIGEGMNASTDILYHAHSNNFQIEEYGTDVSYDVENASSRNPFSHGMTLVSNILKTIEKERPILVLGLPGLLSTFIGLIFGYLTISQYLSTGRFPIGLALSSALFGLAGVFAIFTAIILHALNQYLDQ